MKITKEIKEFQRWVLKKGMVKVIPFLPIWRTTPLKGKELDKYIKEYMEDK